MPVLWRHPCAPPVKARPGEPPNPNPSREAADTIAIPLGEWTPHAEEGREEATGADAGAGTASLEGHGVNQGVRGVALHTLVRVRRGVVSAL